MARTRYPTLLDVIQAVSEVAASDQGGAADGDRPVRGGHSG
jgi:hypothetical protein